jgi:hypothetical protein
MNAAQEALQLKDGGTMTTTEPQFEVIEYRDMRKGDSLRGFVSLRTPSGMVIHDLTYHERTDGARWIGMPARQYTTTDGTTAWARIIDFSSKEAQARFQKLARAAVDRYFAEHATDGVSDQQAALSQKRCDDAKARVQRAAREHDAAVAGRK